MRLRRVGRGLGGTAGQPDRRAGVGGAGRRREGWVAASPTDPSRRVGEVAEDAGVGALAETSLARARSRPTGTARAPSAHDAVRQRLGRLPQIALRRDLELADARCSRGRARAGSRGSSGFASSPCVRISSASPTRPERASAPAPAPGSPPALTAARSYAACAVASVRLRFWRSSPSTAAARRAASRAATASPAADAEGAPIRRRRASHQ